MRREGTLYLHFPCFDGLVSAVLASDFLEQNGWKFNRRFCPVNYHLRPTWISSHLRPPCAVVDFLYHSDAQFWADHHSTTFLSGEMRAEYESRKSLWVQYDSQVGSCALLLWKNLSSWFVSKHSNYQEMVYWADKIDSARYLNVQEAILGDSPALKIYRSLILRSDTEFCVLLIRALRRKSLAEVARLPEILNKSEEVRSLNEAGLKRFRNYAHLEFGDIVVFDLDASPNDIVSRYAPFYFFPKARYSIGMTRREGTAKITAMRNPWLEFESVPLGAIFERYGGGGHQRVASVILTKMDAHKSDTVLSELVSEIQKQDSTYFRPIRQALG